MAFAPVAHEARRRRTADPVSWYLASIGRIPLLTPAEEIELGNQVQTMMALRSRGADPNASPGNKRALRTGCRAKQRMMKANLRLVVSIAKRYQGKGMDLLDLIQEGSLGLERAVEKFDPGRGYKFSTYAFWWIRQSMTRCIACQSRTIRLPVHLSERLGAVNRVTTDLAHKHGAMPGRAEIAQALNMPPEELDGLLQQALTTSSLDAPVNSDDSSSSLAELVADQGTIEPMDIVERRMQYEQIDRWLSHLSDQESKVLKLRFGLDGGRRYTLADIGHTLDVSRERVRQVELKALRKLRNLNRKLESAEQPCKA